MDVLMMLMNSSLFSWAYLGLRPDQFVYDGQNRPLCFSGGSGQKNSRIPCKKRGSGCWRGDCSGCGDRFAVFQGFFTGEYDAISFFQTFGDGDVAQFLCTGLNRNSFYGFFFIF